MEGATDPENPWMLEGRPVPPRTGPSQGKIGKTPLSRAQRKAALEPTNTHYANRALLT